MLGMRPGFSLVEALVALALFQIGMLALAATTMVAARDMGSAGRRARAVAIAQNGVETLRLSACDPGGAAGMRVLAGGFTEHWRVEATGARRVVVDSVVYALPTGRTGQITARAAVLCA